MRIEVNKGLLHGALPAALMSVSVGQIYAFTNFAGDISSHIGCSESGVQWAFSLGILFLGLGAAFFGRLTERDIRASACVGSLLFLSGLLLAQWGVIARQLPLVLAGYGALVGLGTGVIYITPVKAMMMWFPGRKALASAVPIVSFGLGSSLATLLYREFIPLGIGKALACFALFYAFPLGAGSLLLRKPAQCGQGPAAPAAGQGGGFSYWRLVKEPFFVSAWSFMLINVTAGLCFIPVAKRLMCMVGYSQAAVTAFVALSGVASAAGRLAYAYAADRAGKAEGRRRTEVLYTIALDSIVALCLSAVFPEAFGVSLLLISACYGAGFSVIPSVLADRFGMADISKIHGAVLTAWGVAGLVGNQIATAILDRFGDSAWGFGALLLTAFAMHAANVWGGISRMDSEMRRMGSAADPHK